jgi:2-deoxy-D-gluconate 3-dehydrogenase
MPPSPFDLSGKVAFVTGGNGGIGKGIALGLAKAGAAVVVAARQAEKSATAVAEIEAAGGKALAVACDVADRASVEAALKEAAAWQGGVDIVVNNAGTNAWVPNPQDLKPEEWDRVIATNLTGLYNVCVLAHPYLTARGGGKIINISSMMAIFGGGTVTAYAASKGGLDQYTKSIAVAWAKDNIQVNAIQPGWIATDMTRGSRSTPAKYENIIDRTPAERYGEPEDLAGPAVFLASPASDFVTGVLLPVDGGYSSQGTSKTIGI